MVEGKSSRCGPFASDPTAMGLGGGNMWEWRTWIFLLSEVHQLFSDDGLVIYLGRL